MARIQAINPTVATLKRTDDDLPRRVPDGADRQGGRAPAPVFVELPSSCRRDRCLAAEGSAAWSS